MWTARKIELLKEAGAADVGVFATGPWLLELTARDFFDRVLRHQFEATGIVEGPTFGFGRDRGGDVALLAEWCAGAEIDLTVVPPTVFDGDLISSTRIRKALLAGRVAQTTRWLSRPYRIRGTVVRGAARGAGLGFPTANLDNIEVLIPADGVYAGRAAVAGRSYGAAVHVGPNATFDETKRGVEVHLLDFNGNLYGQQIELDFIEYLRPTRQFGGVDALLAQIQQDVSLARRILTQTSD
jgi:riboflavin kinase/FMN adenylyltransferase